MEDLTTSKLCLDVKKTSELSKRVKEAYMDKLRKKEHTFFTLVENVEKWMTQLNGR